MNKKKLYIIIAAVAAVVALIIIILIINRFDTVGIDGDSAANYQPEFMNEQEKSAFELPADSQIQVLKRDEAGAVKVYKIIRAEGDIETNLEEIK